MMPSRRRCCWPRGPMFAMRSMALSSLSCCLTPALQPWRLRSASAAGCKPILGCRPIIGPRVESIRTSESCLVRLADRDCWLLATFNRKAAGTAWTTAGGTVVQEPIDRAFGNTHQPLEQSRVSPLLLHERPKRFVGRESFESTVERPLKR
jgi:hypothetical protein